MTTTIIPTPPPPPTTTTPLPATFQSDYLIILNAFSKQSDEIAELKARVAKLERERKEDKRKEKRKEKRRKGRV